MDKSWIIKGLTKPGKTKSGLARAMGIPASGVTGILNGTRALKAIELKPLAEYLGEDVPESLVTVDAENRQNENHDADPAAQARSKLRPDVQPAKPLTGLNEGASEPPFAGLLPTAAKMSILAGKSVEWSEMIVSETPVERVTRPWFLGESNEVFGLIVATDNMAPVILAGDWVIVNELLAPRREREAVFCSAKENLTFKAIVARYIGQTTTHWTIEEFSPGQEGEGHRQIPKSTWPYAFPIVAKLNRG